MTSNWIVIYHRLHLENKEKIDNDSCKEYCLNRIRKKNTIFDVGAMAPNDETVIFH